jgi:hypothetical protein
MKPNKNNWNPKEVEKDMQREEVQKCLTTGWNYTKTGLFEYDDSSLILTPEQKREAIESLRKKIKNKLLKKILGFENIKNLD